MKFRVTLDSGRRLWRKCKWVRMNPDDRCALAGVSDTCHATYVVIVKRS